MNAQTKYMFNCLIVLLISALLLLVLALVAINKGYNVQIKNKLLGEIKLEKNNKNGK